MELLQQLLPSLLMMFYLIHNNGDAVEIFEGNMLPGHGKIVKEFDNLLTSLVNQSTGLFDGVGSIDVAVWKRFQSNGTLKPLYVKAFGKSQIKSILSDSAFPVDAKKPSVELQSIADKYLGQITQSSDMINARDDGIENRNQYRIASITKSFMGYIANYLDLDLDEKISPKYVNLSTLGKAHQWDTAFEADGYSSSSASSSVFINSITFRHLLTHTSGLSRESKKGDKYSYGSSRTSTPACPPANEGFTCSNDADLNWRPWTKSILQYMMPACGYSKYPDKSTQYNACLPGKYYHYSNAGYSILGLALDSFLEQNLNVSLETFFQDKIVGKGLKDTSLSWIYFNKTQKEETTHGCYGGEDRMNCDAARALTDYSDRGIKTPPGGIWSTTTDLAKFMLNMIHENPKIYNAVTNKDNSQPPGYDGHSEEDPSHMPLSVFKYGHGFYVADSYTCSGNHKTGLYGSWGTVPGFTSYAITTKGSSTEDQYTVVMVRSYNHNKRLNLGNQARRLAWRLLNPSYKEKDMTCPVTVCDAYCNGDKVIEKHPPVSASVGITLHRALMFLTAGLLLAMMHQ